jgi:hypothetical protein
MPTFPTYRGELPQCLNPLNLRYYLLLAYWVYFRPTALKCYLYQADPDLYRTGPGLGIFRTLRVPAYRNLYLMVPGVAVLFSLLVGLPVMLAINWIQGTSVEWLRWAFDMAISVAAVVAVGVVFSAAGGVARGVARGVVEAVMFGVALGVAFSVAGGVVLGVAEGVASDVVGGLAIGAAVGTGFSGATGVAMGVAIGLAGGLLFSIHFSLLWRCAAHSGRDGIRWSGTNWPFCRCLARGVCWLGGCSRKR